MRRLHQVSDCGLYTEPLTSPVAVDLFCGAGGLTQGFRDAGLDVVLGLDHSAAAIETYRSNHDHDALQLDLSDVELAVSTIRPYRPNIAIAGTPCQDFSSAGTREEGQRADLTYAFAMIGIALQCDYLVMENVARAVSARAYNAALARLRSAGYGISLSILDAAYFGVPQTRKRAVMVAKRGVGDDWLQSPAKVSEVPMTVRGYLGEEIDVNHYYRHPRSYHRRSVFSVDTPSPTVRGVHRPVPPRHPSHPGDTADIATVRPLTAFERSRIQTFPADYRWCGSRTAIDQMIGNAVPCALASAIGRAVLADYRRDELYRAQIGVAA